MSVLTFLLASFVVTLTVLGAYALPWTSRELAESQAAWEGLFRSVGGGRSAPVLAELPADDLLPAPLPVLARHTGAPRAHVGYGARSALAR